MSMYPGSSSPDLTLLPDTNSSLITFNVAALQSMMQAVAKEVAERVRLLNTDSVRHVEFSIAYLTLLLQIVVEGPVGIKLRETADKVIGLKQELATMKQAQKAQGSTQDSLRAAVSALDKQVQVLPSTLAKQLAQPAEDVIPKTKSEAALQRQPTEVQPVADVFDKQLNQWTGVLDQVHPDDNEPAHVRLARLDKQQQQQVPLTRQLIVEPTAPAVQPQQAQQAQRQPPTISPPADLTPAAPVIVQVLFCMVHTVQLLHH